MSVTERKCKKVRARCEVEHKDIGSSVHQRSYWCSLQDHPRVMIMTSGGKHYVEMVVKVTMTVMVTSQFKDHLPLPHDQFEAGALVWGLMKSNSDLFSLSVSLSLLALICQIINSCDEVEFVVCQTPVVIPYALLGFWFVFYEHYCYLFIAIWQIYVSGLFVTIVILQSNRYHSH